MLPRLSLNNPVVRAWLSGCATMLAVVGISALVFVLVSIVGLQAGGKQVLVPEVVGQPEAEAIQRLAKAGLDGYVSAHHYHGEIPPGQVVSSTPRALARVRAGRRVALVISSGKRKIAVPNLVGLGLTEAKRILTDTALTGGQVTRRHSDQPAGQIVGQKPAAGRKLARGEKVGLVVSGGPNFGQLVGPDGEVLLLRQLRVVVPVGPIVQRVRITLTGGQQVKTIYDRIHRPGDEIAVDLTGAPGDRVEVYIEDQRVERIRL